MCPPKIHKNEHKGYREEKTKSKYIKQNMWIYLLCSSTAQKIIYYNIFKLHGKGT